MIYTPRILDASALVELFAGHPDLMGLLDDAEAGQVVVLVPTLAIAEAQVVLDAAPRLWDHILGLRGLRSMELTESGAVEVGRLAATRLRHHRVHEPLTGALMVAHVLHEAFSMSGLIVTRVPQVYRGHDVTLMAL